MSVDSRSELVDALVDAGGVRAMGLRPVTVPPELADDPEIVALVTINSVNGKLRRGDTNQLDRELAELDRMESQLVHPRARWWYLHTRADVAFCLGRYEDAVELGNRAIASVARASSPSAEETRSWANVLYSLCQLGATDEVIRRTAEVIEARASTSLDLVLHPAIADILLWLDEPEVAAHIRRLVVAEISEQGPWRARMLRELARAELMMQRVEEAAEILDLAVAVGATQDLSPEEKIIDDLLRAEVELARSRNDEAEQLARSVWDRSESRSGFASAAPLIVAECRMAAEDPSGAAEVLERSAPADTVNGRDRLRVLTLRARVHEALGEQETAAAILEEALDLAAQESRPAARVAELAATIQRWLPGAPTTPDAFGFLAVSEVVVSILRSIRGTLATLRLGADLIDPSEEDQAALFGALAEFKIQLGIAGAIEESAECVTANLGVLVHDCVELIQPVAENRATSIEAEGDDVSVDRVPDELIRYALCHYASLLLDECEGGNLRFRAGVEDEILVCAVALDGVAGDEADRLRRTFAAAVSSRAKEGVSQGRWTGSAFLTPALSRLSFAVTLAVEHGVAEFEVRGRVAADPTQNPTS